MEEAPCISQIARLLAEPKRAAMLWSLMDSSPKSAEELATAVGLSTASTHAHLARLTNAGLLRFETRAGCVAFAWQRRMYRPPSMRWPAQPWPAPPAVHRGHRHRY